MVPERRRRRHGAHLSQDLPLRRRLVDFVVLVQTLQLDGTWTEAARADCCHGYVHLHHANGQVSAIGPLHDVGDVASLFDVASTQVLTYAVTIRDMKGSGDGDV